VSVSFYMDHQVPAAITKGLRQRGIDVVTALEDGTAVWDDERVLERATQLGRVVFTRDDDFLRLAHEWQDAGREFGGVAYAHQLRITVRQAIDDLELIALAYEPEDMRNRVEYLPFS
jgi:hypothetical protein